MKIIVKINYKKRPFVVFATGRSDASFRTKKDVIEYVKTLIVASQKASKTSVSVKNGVGYINESIPTENKKELIETLKAFLE